MQETFEPQLNQEVQNRKFPKKSRRNKFIFVLFATVFVAVTSLIGWSWYSQSHAYEETISQQDQQITNLEKKITDLEKAAGEANTSDSMTSKKYLEIAQWGVKLTPTESAMSYSISNLGGNETLQLTNVDVAKLGDSCTSESYLAIVSRYKQKLDENEENYTATYIGQIGSYYYYVTGANGTCSENPSETSIRNAIVAAAKTLQVL